MRDPWAPPLGPILAEIIYPQVFRAAGSAEISNPHAAPASEAAIATEARPTDLVSMAKAEQARRPERSVLPPARCSSNALRQRTDATRQPRSCGHGCRTPLRPIIVWLMGSYERYFRAQ